MKKGSINELDFNILCKWILHKGTEVQAVCNSMDVVAKECNLKMEKAVIQDKNTILNTIEKAADKFTQQMIDVTHDATDEFKEILSSKQRLSFSITNISQGSNSLLQKQPATGLFTIISSSR